MEASFIAIPFYVFAAICAVTACGLWFRFIVRRSERAKAGLSPSYAGLEETGTAAALALGLAGFGFLISAVV